MVRDQGQTTDLSAQFPDAVKEIKAIMLAEHNPNWPGPAPPLKSDDGGLVVAFNETDGNRTVSYGGRRLVGGVPTIWSAKPVCCASNADPGSSKADPKGLDCWAWPRQIVSKVYESGARKFTQTQNWGSWSVAHAVSDSTLDLTVSITNSWNRSIDMQGITISLFGSEVGPAQTAWDFGDCANSSSTGGCKSVRAASSAGTCPGSFTTPETLGSPRCTSEVPQILVADAASCALVATMPTNPQNLSFGFPWVAKGFRLEVFADVAAGQTVSAALSLRFAPGSGPQASPSDRLTELLQMANDTFADWRAKVPNTVKWPDRGPIGGLCKIVMLSRFVCCPSR